MSQDKRDIAIEKAKKIIEQYPDKNDYVCKYIVRSYDHNNNPTDNSIELDEFWEDCKRIIAPPLPSKEQGTGADKTAMQMLIDKMNDAKNDFPAIGFDDEFVRGFNKAFQMACFIAEQFGKPIERQQIIDTVDDCWTINDKQGYVPSGEQYYSNKYGSQP